MATAGQIDLPVIVHVEGQLTANNVEAVREAIARTFGLDGGVWVHFAYDGPPYLIAAFPTELDALRSLNTHTHGGHVGFLPFGCSLDDVKDRP